MQLLIVHRDAALGRQLVQMVKNYTAHDCELAGSDVAALEWARRHSRCRLLLTQLEADRKGEKIAGLPFGSSQGLVKDVNHDTRSITFGPDNKMYVSMGSDCDACDEGDSQRDSRGV